MSETVSCFEKDTIFWVGDDIDNENNKEKLETYLNSKIERCQTEEELFTKLFKIGIKFKLIYVVINGNLIDNFFKSYSQKIKDIKFILANIIICKNIYEHIKKKYINDLFYNPGGITDDIRNVSK